MGGEPGQRAPTGDVGHLELEAARLRRRGRVVQLVCESRRERTQRQKPVAVALHCCVVRDHGNEHVHDGLEDRRLGHQQAPKCVRLDEEEPAVDGCPRRPSQQLAREDGDSPQEPAGLVMEEWQLVAGDVDRGLELTLEEKPPVDRLLVSAEDVLAGAVRLLYAVLRQLAQPLVGQIGEDRDPAQLAGVHQCAFRY